MPPITRRLIAALCATAVLPAIAAGDAEAGRALYQARCAACHSLDYNGVGPAHRGVFGRAAAQAPGFAYSPALKAARWVWSEDTLDHWLADPEKVAPGSAWASTCPTRRSAPTSSRTSSATQPPIDTPPME
jgi:cytochrome c